VSVPPLPHLAFARTGAGPPLLLLHGLGLSRRSWEPVLPALAEDFDVIAVDLPGFGGSPPVPAGIEPAPAVLAAVVAGLLDELGLPAPHVVGNSLGGWVALELARLRPVASLTLLSPAGLWRRGTPWYDRVSLRISRWLSRHAAGPLCWLARFGPGRALVLGQSHGRPLRMTPQQARAAITDLGRYTGFDATFAATVHRRFLAGTRIAAPVTVAFGSRDLILLPHQSRHLDQLPPHTRVATLPHCGHIPMPDDPPAVTTLINHSTRRGGLRVPG
jgi:pimeloyl-ACP methyl ester carboxylesterase